GECLSLDEQIRMFENTVKNQLASKFNNTTQLSQHLSKSIFIFSVGNNDYINTYFGFLQTRRRFNPQQFAKLLIDTLSQQLQKLYNLGARKMVIFELGPIGCIPSIVRRLRDSSNPCCEAWGNGTFSCIPQLTPCLVPDEHYFWDGYHLTQATCSVIASRCISGSDLCLPMNIQQLVQA
ncbi:GDSL esterase/lipase 7, partial [Bienertia sinuspersici]